MGNLSNRAIHQVFGCPSADNTTIVEFTNTTSTIVELEPNELYRFASTEDCYINIGTDELYTSADSDSVPMFAGVPEIFSTTGAYIYLAVIRAIADGELSVTKMLTRGN